MKCFWILLGVCWPLWALGAASGEPAWLKQYETLASVTAHISQSKRAPYLLKDLQSEIDLAFDGKTITWELVSPVKKRVSITNGGEAWSVEPQGSVAGTAGMPPEMRQFGQLLFAILRWDRTFLSADYSINWTQTAVEDRAVIQKKAGQSHGMDINLHFSRSGILQEIVLKSGDEVTTMRVTNWTVRMKS